MINVALVKQPQKSHIEYFGKKEFGEKRLTESDDKKFFLIILKIFEMICLCYYIYGKDLVLLYWNLWIFEGVMIIFVWCLILVWPLNVITLVVKFLTLN